MATFAMDGDAAVQGELLGDSSTIMYIGQHETQRQSGVTAELLRQAQESGYDMLTTPVTTSHFQSRVLASLEAHIQGLSKTKTPSRLPLPLISPLTPQDSDLTPEESNSSLIAVVSPWIDLGSLDPLIAHVSRQVFNLEVAYAAFCGISNLLIQGPISSEGTTQYARAVLEALNIGSYLQLHILMPMSGELEQDVSADGTHLAELSRNHYPEEHAEDDEPDAYASWDVWNTIRTICSYNSRLTIALELPRQLPPINLQSRWYSEVVRLLMLPRTSFLRNAKGFPVLSKAHQQYLTRSLSLRFPPWVLLSDVDPIAKRETESNAADTPLEPTPAEASLQDQPKKPGPFSHLQYMRHLQQTQPLKPPIERFGQGYQDYLQSPLQPLTDNLESVTYEVFEKDPVKYEWYERAIILALKDLRAKLADDRQIFVAVVGAGRGPLVTRVLQASHKSGVPVKCWAIEKNPNAYVLLQCRNATDPLWNKQVHVVKSDMRSWPGPTSSTGEITKADILVSELLGSFADNELSPECLDGVQHALDLDHGISVPQSYSAHFTPISAPKLRTELLSRASTDLNLTVTEKWELPYVVMLHQHDFLSLLPSTEEEPRTPDVREAWSFSHPQPPEVLAQARQRAGGTTDAGGWVGGDGSNEHNARSCTVTFPCPDRGVCHGIAGYFETVLYSSPTTGQSVELSTNPLTMAEKSKDMISWFPIFFPLQTSLYVPDRADVVISMWRQTDDRMVWYEWVVEVLEEREGRKTRVGMSELHSSRKNGCLM